MTGDRSSDRRRVLMQEEDIFAFVYDGFWDRLKRTGIPVYIVYVRRRFFLVCFGNP